MLARVRSRLTYANVVATLALFVALGGSAYAVTQITSKHVKNRSLRGADLRRNTLTGKEINEARLRQVPAARQAETAGISDLSKSSETAATAGIADVARDAQALAGQGAGAFEKSTRVQFASAPLAPSSSSAEQTLFSWPEMGAELRTSSSACAAGKVRLRLRKTHGPYTSLYEDGNQKMTLVGGQDVPDCSNATGEYDGTLANETGLTFSFECLAVNNAELRCFGIRSQP